MQIIIIASQGAGKTTVAEKIRDALGDGYSIVEEAPQMVSPSGLKEIFTSHESWVTLACAQQRGALREVPAFAIPFLGYIPDANIASHLGWPPSAVRTARVRLGMAPCTRGRPAKKNADLYRQVTAAFLAAKKAAGFITPTEE